VTFYHYFSLTRARQAYGHRLRRHGNCNRHIKGSDKLIRAAAGKNASAFLVETTTSNGQIQPL